MQSVEKRKIIFYHTYPVGTAPGQRFRYEQYLEVLSQEYELEMRPFLSHKLWEIYYQKGKFLYKSLLLFLCFSKRFFSLFTTNNAQIFVFRELAPAGPPILEFILAKVLRKKYIFDFDDAIWLPNYSAANSKFQWVKAYWKVNYCMKWASKISAGNDYLAAYAKKYNSNVVVIPTTIDTEKMHNVLVNHAETPVVIGWTGTHSTMHYLDILVPILKKLEEKYTFKFRVISDQTPNFKLNSLEFVPWNKETEIADLSKVHIGLMPLKEDAWSEGKCGFKGLQYMSLGIASIMSPVGVNKSIIEHNVNGLLVGNESEWEAYLIDLLQNPQKRIQLGLAGRKRVEDAYSVKSQIPEYVKLFQVK